MHILTFEIHSSWWSFGCNRLYYSQNKSKFWIYSVSSFTSEILGTPSLLHTIMIFTKVNVYWCPSCKLNGVTYARYWLLESALYIGLLSNLFNMAPSWGWGGRGCDVYIRERGYLSVHCLVTGHGPGPGTLAALPMHALSWTLEAALGQCSHAGTYYQIYI